MFSHQIDDAHRLRLLDEADAGELYAVVVANRDYLSPWMPWAPEQTQNGVRATSSAPAAGR
jgi:hypothetical protein